MEHKFLLEGQEVQAQVTRPWPPLLPASPVDNGQVHIWTVNLDQDEDHLDCIIQKLARDEQDRASRFHHRLDRSRYVMSRWVLREILGACLNVASVKLAFSYAVRGKPYLACANHEPASADNLAFNMARSGGTAIYAVAWGRQVGIDIELLRSIPDRASVARHFFSPRELATLESLPEDAQDMAFLTCWTRKEAFLKALGVGLAEYPLDSFDVSLAPGEPAELVNTRTGSHDTHRWRLVDVDPGPGYVAALCVEAFHPLSSSSSSRGRVNPFPRRRGKVRMGA